MISVDQAVNIVKEHSAPTNKTQNINVGEALGYTLAQDVFSPINMPPFRQSAMDGYALHLNGGSSYQIIGEVKAGDNLDPQLKTGQAVRIFTGAPVPDSANAVIMQEKVLIKKDILQLNAPVAPNQNIRSLGEQVQKGELALGKGTLITPAAVGFLSSLGIAQVLVYKNPSIAILVTGNELAQVGDNLAHGQVYESNAIMLSTLLHRLGYLEVTSHKVADDYQSTFDLLKELISNYDVVIVSGGISVGDYDFVGRALNELKVTELFYKVKQKPGKPLFFGKKEETLIFALPGNPGAALTCFYMYLQLALQRMCGNLDFTITKTIAKSDTYFTKTGDRSQFLKAIYKDNRVQILDGQSSSMLHTFALANAFVYMPEHCDTINLDDEIQVLLFPIS